MSERGATVKFSGLWAISDHLCSKCFGRVLVSDDGSVARCSNCGHSASGGPESICCCGVRMAARCGQCGRYHHSNKVGQSCVSDVCDGTVVRGPNAGLKCVANDQRTPEFPGEVVVVAVGAGGQPCPD